MPELIIEVGGRVYEVACEAGQEHVRLNRPRRKRTRSRVRIQGLQQAK